MEMIKIVLWVVVRTEPIDRGGVYRKVPDT